MAGMEGKGRGSGHTTSNVRGKVERRVDGGGVRYTPVREVGMVEVQGRDGSELDRE